MKLPRDTWKNDVETFRTPHLYPLMDGRLVVHNGQSVRVVNFWTQSTETLVSKKQKTKCLVLSDGRFIIFSAKTIFVWDLRDQKNKLLLAIDNFVGPLICLCQVKTNCVALSSANGILRVLDFGFLQDAAQCLTLFQKPMGPIHHILSMDDQTFVTFNNTHDLQKWSLQDNCFQTTPIPKTPKVNIETVIPFADHRMLIITTSRGFVMWDTKVSSLTIVRKPPTKVKLSWCRALCLPTDKDPDFIIIQSPNRKSLHVIETKQFQTITTINLNMILLQNIKLLSLLSSRILISHGRFLLVWDRAVSHHPTKIVLKRANRRQHQKHIRNMTKLADDRVVTIDWHGRLNVWS